MRVLIFLLLLMTNVLATQMKDTANTVGVRDNQFVGYGLVVGLNGSGDGTSSKFTLQSIFNLLQGMNIKIDPNDIRSKDTAAVMVTAKLPAFARSGDKLDITVSSMGDAEPLQDGTLLLTALHGIDGEIYAIAQGFISTGGLTARPGEAGSHPTIATVMGGANVEKEIPQNFNQDGDLVLSLKITGFKTASDIERILDTIFEEDMVRATDSRTVKLKKPEDLSNVDFMAEVLEQGIAYTPQSKVIIDERAGTVTAGVDIEIEPVLVTHKDITIKIDPNNNAAAAQNEIDMKDGGFVDSNSNTLGISNAKSTVANIARMLNKPGVMPDDIIAVMGNLKRVGAINADLEII